MAIRSIFYPFFILVVTFSFLPSSMAGAQQDRALRNLVISSALALRTGSIIEPQMLMKHYALLPPTSETEPEKWNEMNLWSGFFRNSIVKLGHLRSETPVVLYYNPIVDVGVLVVMRNRDGRRFDLISMRALPGELLSGDGWDAVSAGPEWTTAARPLSQLSETTKRRLASFAKDYPLKETSLIHPASPEGPDRVAAHAFAKFRLTTHYAALIEEQKTMGRELVETMRAWLGENAALPAQIVDRLELDAASTFGNKGLAIFSMPNDGHAYFAVVWSSEGSVVEVQHGRYITLAEKVK